MKSSELFAKLDRSWKDFNESYAGLSEREMSIPGVTGTWSVREIIAHVTVWEEEALTHLPTILRGGRPPRYSLTYGGIDVFNARTTERMRDVPLAGVLRRRDETHQRLLDFLQTIPENEFIGETRFRRRLRADTYGHYPKHAAAIRRWRKQ